MSPDLKSLFNINAELDEKIVNKLLTAIVNGASSDFDYLKFKHSYLSLIQMGMDASMAPQSAFVTAKTMGVTKASIIKSIEHYIRILSKEKDQFVSAVKNQISSNLDGPGSKMEELKNKLMANENKIVQLQKENEIIKQQIEKLAETQEGNRMKIQQTKEKFDQSYDAILNQMQEDLRLYETIL